MGWGVHRESSPFASALAFPAGEETSASLTAHAMKLLSLYLMQDMGVGKTRDGKKEPGMRQNRHKLESTD